ncbi:hypothetical protein [Marinicella meishanensis]|uniref:hypothetical protein n=1 Tax=Marinicella meishanensis TaxID=2873263 RepID=UPI001CBBB5D1|nr:hypothetical protein [Marinicella sp. NBU2979]
MKNTIAYILLLYGCAIFAQTEEDSHDEWLEFQSCLDGNTVSIIKDTAELKERLMNKAYLDFNEILLDIGHGYNDEFLALMKESIVAVNKNKSFITEKNFDQARKSHDLQFIFTEILRKKYTQHHQTEACTLNGETFDLDFRRLMEPSLAILKDILKHDSRFCAANENCIKYLDYQYLFVISVLLFEHSLLEYIQEDIVFQSYELIKNKELRPCHLKYLYDFLQAWEN